MAGAPATTSESQEIKPSKAATMKSSRSAEHPRTPKRHGARRPAIPESAAADQKENGSANSAPRLKTSKEVYDMVRTDPAYDAEKCDIVYHDRVANRYMRTRLSEWTPASEQGDVPLHRVWFFAYNGATFWDRERRWFDPPLLRRLASGADPPAYQNVTRAAQPFAKALPSRFRIATLNAIFEAGDYRVPDTGSRLLGIGEALRRLEADVILLQECTRAALEFLGRQSWVREGYEMIHTDLVPHGQVTLSRSAHVRASQHSLSSSNKKALNVSFRTANGVDFETWNVNFAPERNRTPTRSSEGQSNDAQHMSEVEQWTTISGAYPAVVAGDFSSCSRREDVGLFGEAADRGWCDAWPSYRHRNKLSGDASSVKAAHDKKSGDMSRAVETRRFGAGRSSSRPDRIYLRSAQLVIEDVRLFEVSESELFEHYGLVADLHVDPSRAIDDYERMGTTSWR